LRGTSAGSLVELGRRRRCFVIWPREEQPISQPHTATHVSHRQVFSYVLDAETAHSTRIENNTKTQSEGGETPKGRSSVLLVRVVVKLLSRECIRRVGVRRSCARWQGRLGRRWRWS